MLRKNLVLGLMTAALLMGVSVRAHAGASDATGDFLGSYVGVQAGDLDVVTADVFYNGDNFTFTTTLAGAVGTTPNAFYVFGVDRGAPHPPAAPFASIGITNVFFDSVIILRPDTTVSVTRQNGGGTTNFGAGTATVSGNTISATFAATELPSTGFAQSDFTWNLWPRLLGGGTANISDFAPNNSNLAVTVVPEASSALLFAPAFLAALGIVILRRRNSKGA